MNVTTVATAMSRIPSSLIHHFKTAQPRVAQAVNVLAIATLVVGAASPAIAQSNQTKKPSLIPEDTSHLLIPVARINPEAPLTVNIVNDTAVPLEYGFNAMEPQEIEPSGEVSLENAPIDTSLFINAYTSAAVLDYAIDTLPDQENTLLVTVSLVPQRYDAAGFSSIDIHESGAIYRY